MLRKNRFVIISVHRSKCCGDMTIFQDGGRRHLGFPKFQTNGQTAQEGRIASPCQIWSKSVEPLSRYGDFSFFSKWRPPPCWIFKFLKFWWAECSKGSNCVTVSNFVEIGQTAVEIWRFFNFSKMATVRHLGFVTPVFGPHTKGGLITVQNLVEIGTVVLIICVFFDFASLA